MAIPLSYLREASTRPRQTVAKSLNEARELGVRTAFLCHSHSDRDLVLGVLRMLQDTKWQVYIDWQDSAMPPTPDRTTASKIKDRIKAVNYFLFLATPNSTASRWCPWEIGYADGVKPRTSIFVLPTKDDKDNFYGNEYLQLYRNIDRVSSGAVGWFEPGSRSGVSVNQL